MKKKTPVPCCHKKPLQSCHHHKPFHPNYPWQIILPFAIHTTTYFPHSAHEKTLDPCPHDKPLQLCHHQKTFLPYNHFIHSIVANYFHHATHDKPFRIFHPRKPWVLFHQDKPFHRFYPWHTIYQKLKRCFTNLMCLCRGVTFSGLCFFGNA